MKEVEEVVHEVKEEELISVTCDCCGKTDNIPYYSDIQRHVLSFGYGSKFDTEEWHIDVCDKCIEAWTNSFEHKPDKIDTGIW